MTDVTEGADHYLSGGGGTVQNFGMDNEFCLTPPPADSEKIC